jgi:hypothetical protein
MADMTEWRGSLPVLRLGPVDTLGVAAGFAASLVIGVALGVGVGLLLRAVGVLAPRLAMAAGLVPLLGFFAYAQKRRARLLAAVSAPSEVVATRGRLVVDGRVHPARFARADSGTLAVHGWATAVVARMSASDACSLVEVLGVSDDGVRTIRVRGPVASIPGIGTLLLFGSPAIATFSGAVLFGASHLSITAFASFAVIFGVSALSTVFALAPRKIVVGASGVEIRWLGRARSIPFTALERMSLEENVLVVCERGAAPRRFLLAIPFTSRATTLEEARRNAARTAAAPVALAHARGLASVFD